MAYWKTEQAITSLYRLSMNIKYISFENNIKMYVYLWVHQVSTITQDNGGQTNTHKALEKALSDLFAPGNGVRENVPRICILLTDGVSTYHTATLAAAQALKDAGIKIITVGIGHKVGVFVIVSMS